jgi:hypothetical protein
MPLYTKNQIWDVLGDKAISFAYMCANSTDPNDKAISFMFQHTNGGFDLNNPIFQSVVLPYLLSKGIIDQAVIDRITALLAE